jgi:RNA polymerase sigma-70 factor (ECF subfamily)
VAFRDVVLRHQDRTYRAAYRILADREEARDVTQEAFLALHRHAAAVEASGVGAWLVRVATNRSIDRVRRRKRLQAVEGDLPDGAPGPAESAATGEERVRVLEALATLPKRQREVLTLRVMEQMTFPEIRRSLGISEGAAKVHFKRGLAALRDRMRRST